MPGAAGPPVEPGSDLAGSDDNGSFHGGRLAGGVFYVRFERHASLAFFAPVRDAVEAMIAATGPVTLFIDAGDLTRYQTEFRERWTEWFKRHLGDVREMHVLVRSQVVEMGLRIGNLGGRWGAALVFVARRLRAQAGRAYRRHLRLDADGRRCARRRCA